MDAATTAASNTTPRATKSIFFLIPIFLSTVRKSSLAGPGKTYSSSVADHTIFAPAVSSQISPIYWSIWTSLREWPHIPGRKIAYSAKVHDIVGETGHFVK
jgi:hypothetical protein